MSKALVILSGGQDSVTCLYWAIKTFDEVEAITFYYKQRHEVELDCAILACKSTNTPIKLVDVSFLPQLVDSALTDATSDVSTVTEKGLPASFVPNRNQLFITLSHAYAQKIGAEDLVMGVCQTDYSGYPDCRQQFIHGIEAVTNNGSRSNIKIHTPLMFLTKAQTFELAQKLGCLREVINFSHTCYEGARGREDLHPWGYGCGECPACLLRKKAFEEFAETEF